MNRPDDTKGAVGAANVSRRVAIASATSMALAASVAAHAANASDPVAELVSLAEEKNAAFMNGEMERWSRLTRLARDFTLMQPFGGPASHGFETGPQRLRELARVFTGGETSLEVAHAIVSEDLVVLVMIERQVADVGGLPRQDWSLRVTEVYRREVSEWRLTHRHADPLVRRIALDQAAQLARGLPPR